MRKHTCCEALHAMGAWGTYKRDIWATSSLPGAPDDTPRVSRKCASQPGILQGA
jgi:hypothetical protein